jgi:hypothetical protein
LTTGFELDLGRIRLADAVYVYLQRTIAPSAPLPPDVAPRAYGLSPAAVAPSGSVVAAVAPGEAAWLGLQAVDPARPVTVSVRIEGSEPVDLVVPPVSRLVGQLFRPGDRVTVLSDGESVAIELVSPERFLELTGTAPEPLDPESAYKGWRLP